MTKKEVRERILKGECLADMFEFTDGQECEIFKGEWNPGDEVIYIPDIDLNEICINRPLIKILTSGEVIDVLSCLYTGRDFMELADGNKELAKRLFHYVDWQHPSSALNEVVDDEEEDKNEVGETMKKEFDWDKFKTENIAVHCKTQNEADMFFELMVKNNLIIKCNKNYWNIYEEDTCYDYNHIWGFCEKEWFENHDYTILEFSDYFYTAEEKEKIKPRYGEINSNGECIIIKEREECSNAEWMYLCDLFGLDYDATEEIIINGTVRYFGITKKELEELL